MRENLFIDHQFLHRVELRSSTATQAQQEMTGRMVAFELQQQYLQVGAEFVAADRVTSAP